MANADRRVVQALLQTGENSFTHQGATHLRGHSNDDGVGVAMLVGDTLRLDKTAHGATHSNIIDRAIGLAGNGPATMVAHVRRATQGVINHDNAHPYFSADGSMALAHNGNVPIAPLERELGADVAANIEGTNDSRLWTRFISDRIATAGHREGISDAVRWLHANSNPRTTAALSGNFVGIGADGSLFACRTHAENTLGVSAIGDAAAGARRLTHAISSEPIGRTEELGGSIARRELEPGEAVLVRPGAAAEYWHTGVPAI
jgi:glutamine phosphoribosylpyrophosphate amidotransferase